MTYHRRVESVGKTLTPAKMGSETKEQQCALQAPTTRAKSTTCLNLKVLLHSQKEWKISSRDNAGILGSADMANNACHKHFYTDRTYSGLDFTKRQLQLPVKISDSLQCQAVLRHCHLKEDNTAEASVQNCFCPRYKTQLSRASSWAIRGFLAQFRAVCQNLPELLHCPTMLWFRNGSPHSVPPPELFKSDCLCHAPPPSPPSHPCSRMERRTGGI